MLRDLGDHFLLERLELDTASYNIKRRYASAQAVRDHAAFVAEVERDGFPSAARRRLMPSLRTVIKQRLREILFILGRRT